MPTAYIKKLAKLNHTTVNKIEKLWSQAKEIAKSEGQGKSWGLITTIFQNRLKKEGYKVSAFYEPDALDSTAENKLDYIGQVKECIKQIWARGINQEQIAKEWSTNYSTLISDCFNKNIEPKVCARMCYIKYHKENPSTRDLNKNHDTDFYTLLKEAKQYFEGLKKWKEDNKKFNKEIEEFMKNEKVTAGVGNKYSYKGQVITASSREEAAKVFAGKNNNKFRTQQVIDAIYKKFDPDFGGLNKWSCKVDKNNIVYVYHKYLTFKIQIKTSLQEVHLTLYGGKTILDNKVYCYFEFDNFKSYMDYIIKHIRTLAKLH